MTHILLNSTTFRSSGTAEPAWLVSSTSSALVTFNMSVRSLGRLLTSLGREYLFAIAGSRTSGSVAMQRTANIGYSIETGRRVVRGRGRPDDRIGDESVR